MDGKRWARFAPAALCALFFVAPAAAELPADAVQKLNLASGEFADALAQAAAKGSPPRLSDAQARPVFDALLDKAAILGAHPYKENDIEALLSVFSAYFNLSKTYLTYGVETGGRNLADNEPEFQDELVRFAEFMILSGAAISESMADYAAARPGDQIDDRRKGLLRNTRSGVGQMLFGMLKILQNPRYTAENRTMLIDALASGSPYFAANFPAESRSAMVTAARDALTSTPPEAQAGMAVFIKAMSEKDCTNLCLLK